MEKLPDLSLLTHEQKDKLILALWDIVQRQAEQIRVLELKVNSLEEKLAKNSKNSSKPPSSDGFNKPNPQSRRNKNKKKKQGGQKGHVGKTLNKVSTPDIIKSHDPDNCWHCSQSLNDSPRLHHEARQEFDLPPMNIFVTEHQAFSKHCHNCGSTTKAQFPVGINQPAQYGPKIKGLMVYMNQYQLLPFDRLRGFFVDIFNQSISVGTIKNAIDTASKNIIPSEENTKEQLISNPLLHVDETGLRVMKESYWLHVASTKNLTFYAAHKKRGGEAIEEIAILPNFTGTLIHDHLKCYFHYGVAHSLCNAHHLRELTFIQETCQHKWALKIEKLLLKIKKDVESHYQQFSTALPDNKIRKYRNAYMSILRNGKQECPRNESKGPVKKGRVKQSKARNLLERLQQFNKSVLAFMYDPKIPFDNNQAERDIRMMKVQQKISGCFRTKEGVDQFCRIRGYISTAKKQGVSIIYALQSAVINNPLMFSG